MRLSWWRRLRLYIWHQGFSFWWPPRQDIRTELNDGLDAPVSDAGTMGP